MEGDRLETDWTDLAVRQCDTWWLHVVFCLGGS